jgi:hypothetical protein
VVELYCEVTIGYNPRSNTYLFDCGSIYTLSAQTNSEVAHNYIVNQVGVDNLWTLKLFSRHPVYFNSGSPYKIYSVVRE